MIMPKQFTLRDVVVSRFVDNPYIPEGYRPSDAVMAMLDIIPSAKNRGVSVSMFVDNACRNCWFKLIFEKDGKCGHWVCDSDIERFYTYNTHMRNLWDAVAFTGVKI